MFGSVVSEAHRAFMSDVHKEINGFLEAHPQYTIFDLFNKKSVWDEALVWCRQTYGQSMTET